MTPCLELFPLTTSDNKKKIFPYRWKTHPFNPLLALCDFVSFLKTYILILIFYCVCVCSCEKDREKERQGTRKTENVWVCCIHVSSYRDREGCWVPISISLCLFPWRQGPSLTDSVCIAGLSASEPHWFSYLHPPQCWGCRHVKMLDLLHGCWAWTLIFLLCNKHTYL